MVRLMTEVLLHLLTGAIVSWAAITYGLGQSVQTSNAQAAKTGIAVSLAQASLAQASPVNPEPAPPDIDQLLNESWAAYRRQFIQADGRVIDRESDDRTVSEGQAYAMLRAVLADDPATFALTLNWAETNLQRRESPQPASKATPNSASKPAAPLDSLWAWKWGQRGSDSGSNQGSDQNGDWGILDANFASDADLDAATALILASRRWNRPDYLELARTKLKDLWDHSTVVGAKGRRSQRYFLPGPIASFQPAPDQVYLNPSYLAPYAFRLFAQVDPQHDWRSLVESSYQVLEDSAQLSEVQLPSDWVVLNLKTGQYSAPAADSTLRSTYSFDAFRVWWRLALDAAWFDEPRAKAYLSQHLAYLQRLWRDGQRIPARINLRGAATAPYEATSQYAMLYPALLISDPAMAAEILQQKLLPAYQNGIWDNDRAYYTQNLVWLGLYPAAESPKRLIQPRN